MADGIEIPGTDVTLPYWAVGVIAVAGVAIIVYQNVKSGAAPTTTAADQTGSTSGVDTALLAQNFNALREELLTTINDQMGKVVDTVVTPPITPPVVNPKDLLEPPQPSQQYLNNLWNSRGEVQTITNTDLNNLAMGIIPSGIPAPIIGSGIPAPSTPHQPIFQGPPVIVSDNITAAAHIEYTPPSIIAPPGFGSVIPSGIPAPILPAPPVKLAPNFGTVTTGMSAPMMGGAGPDINSPQGISILDVHLAGINVDPGYNGIYPTIPGTPFAIKSTQLTPINGVNKYQYGPKPKK